LKRDSSGGIPPDTPFEGGRGYKPPFKREEREEREENRI